MRKWLIIGEVFLFAAVATLIVYSLSHRNILDKYSRHKSFADVRATMEDNLNLIKKNPHNDSAYYSLGQGFFGLEGYDDAIWALKEATKISPKTDFYFVFLGKAYQAKKDYPSARDAFSKALQLEPNRATNYTTLAWLYYFRLPGEQAKAYEVLKKGLEKFPEDKGILFDITRYYLYDKNTIGFRTYAPRYLKIDPTYTLIKDAYEKGIR